MLRSAASSSAGSMLSWADALSPIPMIPSTRELAASTSTAASRRLCWSNSFISPVNSRPDFGSDPVQQRASVVAWPCHCRHGSPASASQRTTTVTLKIVEDTLDDAMA
jgi:hypothetical protein